MPAFPNDPVAARLSAALGDLPAGSAASAVATRMLDLFTSGSIAAGTRLPPERQLAAQLGVGRSAIREALAALEILGIVDVRPGSGTYLRGTASDLLPQSLRWGVLIGERTTQELLELRVGLEIHTARLAAERLTDDQLTALDACVEDMHASLADLPEFVKADLRYHHLLAEAAGNRLLLDLLQVVRSLLRVWSTEPARTTGSPRPRSTNSRTSTKH